MKVQTEDLSDIKNLTKAVVAFRDAREWKKFHNPKELAIGISVEAGEVLEHFVWKTPEECLEHAHTHKEDIADELSDVLYSLLIMAHDLDIDLGEAFLKKLKKTGEKYPVEKSKGSSKKYTEL